MAFVCTPLTGFMNCIEWLTVSCEATPGNADTPLYAAHISDYTVVPSNICCLIIGSSWAASL